MAVDFSGAVGLWNFNDWALETFTVKQRPTTGRAFTTVATGVTGKANVERQGLMITEVAVEPAYTRKFYFPCSYRKGGGVLDPTSYIVEGNVLVDDESKEWVILSVSNAGGADEHLEVEVARRPAE